MLSTSTLINNFYPHINCTMIHKIFFRHYLGLTLFLLFIFSSSTAFCEYLLVVSSHKKMHKAKTLAAELQEIDYKPFIKTINSPERGTWHGVYLGPFADAKAAQEAKLALGKKQIGHQMFIINARNIQGNVPSSSNSSSSKNENSASESSEQQNSLESRQDPEKPGKNSAQQNTRITLEWSASEQPNLQGYKIYYDTQSGPPYDPPQEDILQEGPPPITVGKDTTSLDLHGLSANKDYYFAITATNESGQESAFSREIKKEVADESSADEPSKGKSPQEPAKDTPAVDRTKNTQEKSALLPEEKANQEQVIQAGDILDISVPGQKQMTKEYDVDPTGKIYMLMVGGINVSQHTAASLGDHLTKMLQKFLVKGEKVTVKPVQQMRYVHIKGGVRYPGWYRVQRHTKLKHLLSVAGGALSGVDTSKIKLKRAQEGKQDSKTYSVKGELSLQPNDILEVPYPKGYRERIDSGDLLFVRIPQRQAPGKELDSSDTADLTRDLKRTRIEVDRNGYIYIPNYGHIDVQDKTPEQVKQTISERLPRYLAELKEEQVSIIEKKHYVQILGHVKNPGDYAISEDSNIQEAVSQAGGAVDGANLSRVRIIRSLQDAKSEIKVNLYQYTITGDIRTLPPLHEGDTLFVPISSSFGNIKRSLMPWNPPSEKLEEDTKSKIRIFGAIHNPGIYELKEDMNVMDLIIEASGETDDADLSKVLLIRDNQIEMRYDFEEFLNSEETKEIPKLQNGDTVYIKYVEKKVFEPKEDKVFYASGKIQSPGKYKLQDDMTLFQAISLAGGMTEWADKDNILIIRRVDGKQRNIPVDYDKAIAGKYPEQNIFIQPNDTIHIP